MKNKTYCIANWKMNFLLKDVLNYLENWNKKTLNNKEVETIICPPYTSMPLVCSLLENSQTLLGAQNIFYTKSGSYTGEISSLMLKELNCKWVIIGHSERRNIIGESDELINKKLLHLLNEDLNPILCVGEKIKDRKDGNTKIILEKQLEKALMAVDQGKINSLIIAYEPVWAIGSGKNADVFMINEAHSFIRNFINKKELNNNNISIIYGGSVNEENAEILSNIENVNGFLIGGSSLDVEKFYSIYNKL